MRVATWAAAAALFVAGLAPAQTSINAARSGCRGDQPRIYAELPATIGTATVMVPICLALAPSLAVDTSTDPPTLRAAIAAAPAPWLAVDRIPLDVLALPASQTEWSYTLQRQPVEGSALFAILQGRPFGMVEAVITNGRQVAVTLPLWRPFKPGDVLVLVYLTVEARAAPVTR